MKKIITAVLSCLLISAGFVSFADAATQASKEAQLLHAEWDMADQEKVKDLEKLGYEKHDIFHALHLSKLAKAEPEKILAYYKETSSWKETAKKFGVDPKEIKHPHHWKKHNELLEKNKKKIVPYLAAYLKTDETEINKYLQDGMKVDALIKASILSKLSSKNVKEIIEMKKGGQSFRDIANELHIEKKAMFKEMKKLKEAITE